MTEISNKVSIFDDLILIVDIDALIARIALVGDLSRIRDEHVLLKNRFEAIEQKVN